MTRPCGSRVIALVGGGLTMMAVCVVAAQEPSVPASAPTTPGPTQQSPTEQAAASAPVERDKSTDPQSAVEFPVNLDALVRRYPLSFNLYEERYRIYSERPISPLMRTLDQETVPVCNIRVIPLDPTIDPGIRRPGPTPNAGGATQYQIRGMEGTCKPSVPVVPQASPRPSK